MNERICTQRQERGVALLVTMFALLLLSVIGLGMMASTSTETSINSNYRDKQLALYAAMGGLQEARDRIQPATLNIMPPTALPSLSAGNVIYIINPRNGETVAPWDTSNKYADSELCLENILGLSGTVGIPCSTVPSGSSWYTVHDDSLSSAGVWHFSRPLDFKWVRVALKTNNMTTTSVNADSSNSNQVCWDGVHQIVLPDGYGPECTRFGSVISINVTNSGAGYLTTPNVSIDAPPPGGIQATAHANMVVVPNDAVQSVTVTNPGSGYLTAPSVVFTGGGGTGAAATAQIVLQGAPVSSVTLNSAGTQCFATEPAVAFIGGGGVGASATTTLAGSNSCIAGWTVNGNCMAHKGDTISGISLSGGGGSGFSGTLTFGATNGNIAAITIENPGNSYTSTPTSITNLNGCGSLTFTASLGKRVQSVSLTSGGGGYTSVPSVSFTTGTGTAVAAPTATATLGAPPANVGEVVGVVVTSGGSGYTSAPTVSFSSASGSGAAANAILTPVGTPYYKVDSITIDNQGYGYTTDPAVTISGGGGTGATATATLGRGANYGKVYLITALAQTLSGAREMLQMEATTPVTGFSAAGALTLDGPEPVLNNMPSSTQFWVRGNDANSCGETAEPDHPAIGAYDDPEADPPTNSVDDITSALPLPDHYTGEGDTPSVQNVYGSLGETLGTTTGLNSLIQGVAAVKTNTGNSVSYGSPTNPAINYVSGDASLPGNADGYGVLVVTGTLTMSGDFHWHGVILVVGDGIMDFAGGGDGDIQGMLLVAKIWDNHTDQNLLPILGTPTINWNGGGNNGVQYDHCLANKYMSKVPFDSPPSTRPLKVLSLRSMPY